MADDKIFIDGLLAKPPHPKAPPFVKGALSINVPRLKAWLEQQEGPWINVDIKESRKTKEDGTPIYYCEVNTYEKIGMTEKPEALRQAKELPVIEYPGDINPEDVPF